MLSFAGKVPLLLPAICFMSGILAGLSGWNPAVALALIIPALILLILRYFYSGGLFLILVAGWIEGTLSLPPAVRQRDRDITHVLAGDVQTARPAGSITVVDVLVDSINGAAVDSRKVRLMLAGGGLSVSDIDRLKWRGELQPLDRGERLAIMDNLADILHRRGFFATSFAATDSVVAVTPQKGWRADLKRIRWRMAEALFDAGFNQDTSILLDALLLGDTTFLTPEVRSQYSAAGLSHILALSGMHVAVIAMLISLALWPLQLPFTVSPRVFPFVRWSVLALIISMLWLYAALTGFSPSVVRAVVMATVYMGGRILQCRSSAYNSLCLAAMVILAVDPHGIFSYGFQLSFAAVLGILLFGERLNPFNQRKHNRAYNIASLFTVSIGAMLGTGLVSAYYFHSFPCYFLLSALCAMLIVPTLCLTGVVGMILSMAGWRNEAVIHVGNGCAGVLDKVSAWVMSLPGASVGPIFLTAGTLVLGIAAVLCLGLLLNTGRRIWVYATGVLFGAAVVSGSMDLETQQVPDRIFGVPYRGCVALMKSEGKWVDVVADVAVPDTVKLAADVRRDFSTFFGKNGLVLREVRLMPWVSEDGRMVTLPLDSALMASSSRAEVGIVSRSFRKRHIQQLSRVDTIYLSPAVSPRIGQAIREYAAARAIPVTSRWGR